MTSPNFALPNEASSKLTPSAFASTKRFFCVSVGLLLMTGLILPVYSAHAKALRSAEVEARATKYCRAIFHRCDSVRVERKEWFQRNGDLWVTHHHWQASCTAGKESAVLQMEEETLHLTAVFNEDRVLPLKHKPASVPSPLSLANPAQAREASLFQLRDLDFFRSGHDYALSEAPTPVFNGQAWRMTWQERDLTTHTSRFLTVLLDAKSKIPLMIFEPLRRETGETRKQTP